MNNANAFGFLTLGTVMQMLPLLAPSTSASASDLWLHLMGAVTGLVGASYLVRVGAEHFSAYAAQVAGRSLATSRASRPVRESLPLGVRVTF